MSEITWKKAIGLMILREKSTQVEGKLRKILSDVGEYKSKGYVIETKGEIVTVVGGTVLDSKIQENGIEPGEFVKIVFVGTKGEKHYKDFEISVGNAN